LTLFLFAFINTSAVRGTLINNAVISTEQSVHLAYLHLKNYHDELVQRGSTITDELQRVASDESEVLERMKDIYHLNIDIVSISLFDEGGQLESYTPNFLKEQETINLFDQEWFERKPEKLQILLSPPHLQSIFEMQPTWVVSMLKNISINGESKYIVVDYDFSQVGDYFNRIAIGERGYAYIASREGEVLYHQIQAQYSKEESDDIDSVLYHGDGKYIKVHYDFSQIGYYFNRIANGERGYAYIASREGEVLYHPKQAQFTKAESDAIDSVLYHGDGTYITENEEYSVGHRTVSHTGWKVVGLSYLDDVVLPAMDEIQELTFYTLVVMFILIVVTSLLVSKFISQPITQMIKQISKAEIEDSEELIHQTRFNEVRQLSESYNRQMTRINHLMDQIKVEQVELRKSEMNVLQAQINPHFLYNTLDSILWMAESGETKETSEMVAALGKLLRISLSQGENLIPLRKELEHAE